MTALNACKAARELAAHDLTSDTATHADLDAAADRAGVARPETADDRHAIRLALDAIGDTQ